MKTVAMHCASQNPGQPFSFSPLLLHRTSSAEPTSHSNAHARSPLDSARRTREFSLVSCPDLRLGLVTLDIVASFPGLATSRFALHMWIYIVLSRDRTIVRLSRAAQRLSVMQERKAQTARNEAFWQLSVGTLTQWHTISTRARFQHSFLFAFDFRVCTHHVRNIH